MNTADGREEGDAARVARRWSVALVGVALSGLALGHLSVAGRPLARALLEAALPGLLALATVAVGVHLARDDPSGARSITVCLFATAGGFVTFLVGVLIITVASERVTVAEFYYAIASAASLGVIWGAVSGVFHDRLRRSREAFRRQNERLDEFASIVSHDLRNPLNVARGHVDLARETGDRSHLDAVERAHDRMERLIETLLVIARTGRGVDGDDAEWVRLSATAEAAWSTVETGDARLAVDADATVLADERRLRQLFENLFRNAIEHGGDEAAGLAVRVGALDGTVIDAGMTDGGTADCGQTTGGFYVSDSGAGIPPQERERVFERGYSTGSGGSGLGLAIVEAVAEGHGWSVDVGESDAGGARFEFRGVAVEPSEK